jgi:tetratricopeptide (TPR) repeat protein
MPTISTTLRCDGVKAARSFICFLFVFVISVVHVVGQDADIPVLRDLDGGEHFFAVELKQGQTLQLDIKEKGVNVSVALIILAEERVVRLANFGAGYDRETLTYIAEKTGTYIIGVGIRTPPTKGRYVLNPQIKETTAATRKRVKAEQLLEEGLAKSKENPAELRESLFKLKESLLSWKTLNEAYWAGYTLFNLGRVHEDLKEQAEALESFNQALPFMRQAQDIHGEAATLNSMGLIKSRLGDKALTLDYYSRALILTKQVGSLEEGSSGIT